MRGNPMDMMKQLQQMQKKMGQMQEQLEASRFEAAAGGLVTCVANGKFEILELTIDGSKLGLDADDTEALQDAVLAAIQDAQRQVNAAVEEQTRSAMGGLQLPPGLGF